MRNRVLLVIAILIVLGVGFYTVNNFLFSQGSIDSVTVDFINETNGKLEVVIVNESNQTRNKPKADFTRKIDIPFGESKRYNFKNSGEGTFSYIVKLESGKLLKERVHYVEGGYYLKEIVRKDSIITNYSEY